MIISSLILRSKADAILGLPASRTDVTVGSITCRSSHSVFSWQSVR
ncbi:hypothetical protein TERTU_2602 [Teredinibacter turnerae T7901]|uniref:Uncharacterized protein n=1 Tax=Teredinibacter turnerae (strain ATCC 39867 / T7901) TaxID=377629 RepID=C5BLT1_TERTT|nr:hypothetical protein [Teredinibacter turnerae]ACR12183.1 hypothetical protein TERTU_2602 [Teredinibacter turnerae T7901]